MAEPITDIPKDKVGETLQDFIDFAEEEKLTVSQQSNGTYTITPESE